MRAAVNEVKASSKVDGVSGVMGMKERTEVDGMNLQEEEEEEEEER